MRFVPAIIIAMALIISPLVYLGVRTMIDTSAGQSGSSGPTVDNSARIDIEMLRRQIEALNARIGQLEGELRRRPAATPATPSAPVQQPSGGGRSGENSIIDSYAQVVIIGNRTRFNDGLTVASPSFLEGFLGKPRANLSDDCQSMTNPDLRGLLVVERVGPVRVQLLRPAIDSLGRVLERIREVDEDLYNRINTSGSLCVRQIRGTRGRASAHAFGLAVDLNIDGQLDNFTDGKTQLGLTILADFFREEGWIWGAGFRREDSMHFEVSRELLERWRREGKI